MDAFVLDAVVRKKSTATLCDKYGPASSAEMLGSQQAIGEIREWLAKYRSARTSATSCLLLSAQTGVGSTTAARLCLREEGFVVLETNASNTRTGKEMKQQLSLLKSCTHTVMDWRPKALFVDEVDALFQNDSSGGDELIKYLTVTRTSDRWVAPIICTCHQHKHGKIMSLAKRAVVVELKAIPDVQLRALAARVQQGEGASLGQAAVDRLIKSARGDARQVLMQMEMGISSGSMISQSATDIHLDVTTAVDKLLQARATCDVHRALELFNTDVSIVPLMVQENYLDSCQLKKCSMATVAAIAESVSMSGVVEERMYGQQAWELYDIYGVFSTVMPCAKACHRGTRKLRFGTLWSKISNGFTKKKSIRRLKACLCTRTSPCLDTMAMLRDVAYGLIMQQDWAALKQLCKRYGLRENDLYDLMKHSSLSAIKPAYRPTSHAKTKKALLGV